MIIGTVEETVAAGRRRVFRGGVKFEGMTDTLFETATGAPLGPQASLVRQAPGWSLPPHFHMQHQFQVVLAGSGRLGRHALVPGAVHYASPQSAYGPLVAGEQGLDYLTLRVLTDKGGWFIPEARPFLQKGLAREQVMRDPIVPSGAGQYTLIDLREDGLGAWWYRADPGQQVSCGQPANASGRFHVVLSGGVSLQGRTLLPQSCVYTAPSEPAPVFTALADGCDLIVVQAPGHAIDTDVRPELRVAPAQVYASA